MNTLEIISGMTVKGRLVYLPPYPITHREFLRVKKRLLDIGGKWRGGNVNAFEFTYDPSPLLYEIITGDKKTDKKRVNLLETPYSLAAEMIEKLNIEPNNSILEPSAGSGAIIELIIKKGYPNQIFIYEKNPSFRIYLNKRPLFSEVVYLGNDFLYSSPRLFDRIISFPPFTEDIEHILRMWEHLADGGVLVTLCSLHSLITNKAKQRAFMVFLEKYRAEIIGVPRGTFLLSGKNIPAVLLCLTKYPDHVS